MVHTHFDPDDCIIKIRDTPIQYVTTVKFLGLTLDNRLSYNDHITGLHKSLSRVRGILLKLSFIMPAIAIRHIYFALFYSRMSYCISVWSGSYITNISKIARVNKRAINVFF